MLSWFTGCDHFVPLVDLTHIPENAGVPARTSTDALALAFATATMSSGIESVIQGLSSFSYSSPRVRKDAIIVV